MILILLMIGRVIMILYSEKRIINVLNHDNTFKNITSNNLKLEIYDKQKNQHYHLKKCLLLNGKIQKTK